MNRLNEHRSNEAIEEAVRRCEEQTLQFRSGATYDPAVFAEVFSKRMGISPGAFIGLSIRIRQDLARMAEASGSLTGAANGTIAGALLMGFNLAQILNETEDSE